MFFAVPSPLTPPPNCSVNKRQNPSRSTPAHDHRVGRAVGHAPPVGDGRAGGVLALRLDFHVDVARLVRGPRGPVAIRVTREARDLSRCGPAVRIDGTDEGEGIGGIYLPRLTGRFCRVVSHRSREQGGRHWPS
jgi:hypothetical protein